MTGMCAVLGASAALFAGCLLLHVIIWRVRRPTSYRHWLPLLAALFLVIGPAIAWRAMPDTPWADRLAVLLLHASMSTVYIIGYTLVSAFSPSIEILKLLVRMPGGLPREAVKLPYLDSALGGNRVLTLVNDGMIHADGDGVRLGARGETLVRLALFYRHTIGLPDGAGG
jgi:hypothetical protein